MSTQEVSAGATTLLDPASADSLTLCCFTAEQHLPTARQATCCCSHSPCETVRSSQPHPLGLDHEPIHHIWEHCTSSGLHLWPKILALETNNRHVESRDSAPVQAWQKTKLKVTQAQTRIGQIGWKRQTHTVHMLNVGTVPCIPNIHNIHTTIEKSWTSFWSPIRFIRELRTKLSRHFEWTCVPGLFRVFKRISVDSTS